MIALRSFKTSVTIYQSIWCNIPEDLNLHQHWCENLGSYKLTGDIYYWKLFMGEIHIKTCLMSSFGSSPFELTCNFVLLHTTQITIWEVERTWPPKSRGGVKEYAGPRA
jgi:hypothetical protein